MNPPSGPRQQQQPQKQNTLTMQKHEITLEFHSRLIEAAEGCDFRYESTFQHTRSNRGFFPGAVVLLDTGLRRTPRHDSPWTQPAVPKRFSCHRLPAIA